MEKLEDIINRKISHRQFAQRNLDIPQFDTEESSGYESKGNHYTDRFYDQLKDNIEEAIDVSYQNGQGDINGSKSKIFMKKVLRKLIKIFFGWYVFPIYDSQNTYNGKMVNAVTSLRSILLEDKTLIDKLFNLSDSLEQKSADLEQKSADLERRIIDLEKDFGNKNYNYETQLKHLYNKYETQLDYLNFKIYQNSNYNTQNHVHCEKSDDSLCIETEQRNQCTYDKIDYFDFENHFRGSRTFIKKNQEVYIKYFIDKNNIVDLGCGRGEFLELLKENGIQATGVDLYRGFVDYCVSKGLNVIQADAIKYLSQLDDDNVGGLFCSQVVEHLHTDQIILICNLAYQKLKNDAYLIIETPNPTCLSIYTNWFYVDPSHVKPIHPLTLEYFLKKAGFKDVKIVYTDNSKLDTNIPRICIKDAENIDEFNRSMEYISNILFGSQDYAIIAKK
jgi:O-antigen chain-terminating methyltransferase